MKEAFTTFILFLLFMVCLVFVSLGLYAITKPLSISIDNAAFHNSQAYNDGMAKDLGNFEQTYITTKDENQRAALRAVILDRFAGYDETRLPMNLRSFLDNLKTGG